MVIITQHDFDHVIAERIPIERHGAVIRPIGTDLGDLAVFVVFELIGSNISPRLDAQRLFIFAIERNLARHHVVAVITISRYGSGTHCIECSIGMQFGRVLFLQCLICTKMACLDDSSLVICLVGGLCNTGDVHHQRVVFPIVRDLDRLLALVVLEPRLIVFIHGRDTLTIRVGIADLDEIPLVIIREQQLSTANGRICLLAFFIVEICDFMGLLLLIDFVANRVRTIVAHRRRHARILRSHFQTSRPARPSRRSAKSKDRGRLVHTLFAPLYPDARTTAKI